MIYLPQGLPAAAAGGGSTGAFPLRAWNESAPGVPRVLFLNLMPEKEVTEADFIRTFAATGRDVWLVPLKIPGQRYKHTPQEHVDRFYAGTDEVAAARFDGLVVTGAPLERIDFEEVRYWPQLCRLMDWAGSHVAHTLYICWGAQAALYRFYGIPKRPLPAKRFGVFAQEAVAAEHPLLQGMEGGFPMPHSRHTEVREEDIRRDPRLTLLARGGESGFSVAEDAAARRVFVTGHLEYAADTLHREYLRDRAKGLPIAPPQHYYEGDSPTAGGIKHDWGGAARAFYGNWLRLLRGENPERPTQ